MVDRNFLINNRAALVASGIYTVDQIVALTAPKNAIAQASVAAQVQADIATNAPAAAQVTADISAISIQAIPVKP